MCAYFKNGIIILEDEGCIPSVSVLTLTLAAWGEERIPPLWRRNWLKYFG
jgi:hypothetical protein